VFSDPVNFIDPSGEIFWFVAIPVAATAAAGAWAYFSGKKLKKDRKAFIDAHISGDSKAIKIAHEKLKQDALLLKGTAEFAGMGLSLGKGLPKSSNESVLNGIDRIFHANKDKLYNESHKFYHEFFDKEQDKKELSCH